MEDKNWRVEDAREEGAEEWMLGAIATSPSYCGWSPGGDYMCGRGWAKNDSFDEWENNSIDINELNRIVDFYFCYDEDEKKLVLHMWMLHPRKGASKGVTIHDVKEKDLPSIYAFLRTARDNCVEQFSRVPEERG